MEKIKIGILGYGNLGKAVEKAVNRQADTELASIYSRRKLQHPLAKSISLLEKEENIDVLILCTGSAMDLPQQTPKYAHLYNVVDSFDHHQQIHSHYLRVDKAAREGGKLALISCGWDPGLFSMMRAMFTAVMPNSQLHTFWGKGISQGHSDAIRCIEGVKDARQYTVPLESAIKKVREGITDPKEMTAVNMHRRECYVVAETEADLLRIEDEIKSMPDYFEGYETTVEFISQEKLEKEHYGFPHGGTVLGVGKGTTASFQLDLSSNPDFTADILTAYARAVYKLAKEGETGCRTMLEIPLSKLCQDMFMHM